MEGRHMLLRCVRCLYINMLLLYYIHYKKNVKYWQKFYLSIKCYYGQISPIEKILLNLPTDLIHH